LLFVALLIIEISKIETTRQKHDLVVHLNLDPGIFSQLGWISIMAIL
jgi:hypothetical protein